jgi:hypothetical protein
MKIAITDITRMQRGYFCVAGVNVDTGERVRPVQPMGRLRDLFSIRHRGPFEMATVIDLGRTRPVPAPPEVEDHEFTPEHARLVRQIEPELFWELLGHLAKPTLRAQFGAALRPTGRDRAIVDEGNGVASLGCLAPTGRVRLVAERRAGGSASLRLRFSDGSLSLSLSVTDLRLWADDHVTPRWDLVRAIIDKLDRGVPCLLSVGLTRPFAAREGERPVHWLQVNNIHLEDDPCWRLAASRPRLVPTGGMADDPDELPF